MATVPADHHVTIYKATFEPSLLRTEGGVAFASTGADGDEPTTELAALLDHLDKEARKLQTVSLSTASGELSDLLLPKFVRLGGVAVLVLQHRSLGEWLTDPKALRAFVDRLATLGQITKLVVYLSRADEMRSVTALCADRGIELRATAEDGTLIVEVRRPEGLALTALAGAAVSAADARAPGVSSVAKLAVTAPDPPTRAPLLNRLLLAVAKDNTPLRLDALLEHLVLRRRSLALIAVPSPSGEAVLKKMSWPGLQAFVVFGDLVTLHRAARETGHQPGAYGVAAMPVAKLFAWCASISVPIALCVYDGPTPFYVPILLPTLTDLAARIRDP